MTAKPWKTPAVGDIMKASDGIYSRRVLGFSPLQAGEYPVMATLPSEGGYSVLYEAQDGQRKFCWCTSWWTWCELRARQGGVYCREDVR